MTVVNLSGRILTKEEENLLALGLSFCPSNNFDYVQTRIDLFHFVRKQKLKKWYKNRAAGGTVMMERTNTSKLCISDIDLLHTLSVLDDDTQAHDDPFVNLDILGIETDMSCRSPFKPKSTFLPAVQSEAIQVFEKDMINRLKKMRYGSKNKKYDNLSFSQKMAVNNLKSDSSIVIRESDKGGNVVVLNKSQYLQEGERQLSDVNCYTRANLMEFKTSILQYHGLLVEWRDRGLLEWDEYQFL
ncbi:hypothetical protein NDU88_008002 [Pleurodeles waltl]|uniref:Uncharacterized protein n=1 Tax=Pleurodeles waltl TaxID=8319 RepID=A0AAV7N599_PLEWA|nr:hypothetical protein NDU88_008002 [Pleurodeles waltl]